jgi:hypothetical protein
MTRMGVPVALRFANTFPLPHHSLYCPGQPSASPAVLRPAASGGQGLSSILPFPALLHQQAQGTSPVKRSGSRVDTSSYSSAKSACPLGRRFRTALAVGLRQQPLVESVQRLTDSPFARSS